MRKYPGTNYNGGKRKGKGTSTKGDIANAEPSDGQRYSEMTEAERKALEKSFDRKQTDAVRRKAIIKPYNLTPISPKEYQELLEMNARDPK